MPPISDMVYRKSGRSPPGARGTTPVAKNTAVAALPPTTIFEEMSSGLLAGTVSNSDSRNSSGGGTPPRRCSASCCPVSRCGRVPDYFCNRDKGGPPAVFLASKRSARCCRLTLDQRNQQHASGSNVLANVPAPRAASVLRHRHLRRFDLSQRDG